MTGGQSEWSDAEKMNFFLTLMCAILMSLILLSARKVCNADSSMFDIMAFLYELMLTNTFKIRVEISFNTVNYNCHGSDESQDDPPGRSSMQTED